MGLHISGLGTATPPFAIMQDDAANMATLTYGIGEQQAPAIATLYRKSGVSSRRCVILESSTNGSPARQSFFRAATNPMHRGPSTGERMQAYQAKAAELAIAAAESALRESGIEASQITHLVTASCTGFHSPGVDLSLCEQLDLPAGVARTHIGFMGCHAALNAIRVADAFASADHDNRVLICAVELCSLHFQYSDRSEHLVSNSLFADGAAALVGHGSSKNAWGTVISSATLRLPATSDLMSWKVGDHGFEMSLSSRVPGAIRRQLRPWVTQWLGEQGLSIENVNSWAIHPGGPRILDACQEALGLSVQHLEPSRSVLENYGNMSSPTVLFVLDKIRRQHRSERCVMLAFGPGLAIEAVLMNLND